MKLKLEVLKKVRDSGASKGIPMLVMSRSMIGRGQIFRIHRKKRHLRKNLKPPFPSHP